MEVGVAYQHGIFPALGGLVFVTQFSMDVLVFALTLKHEVSFVLPTHDDDAPLGAPATQAQLVFAALPALAHGAPVLALPLAFDELFDTTGLAQLGQVRLLELLRPENHTCKTADRYCFLSFAESARH